MTYRMFIAFIFAALCKTDVGYGYINPKYTWPLHSENPLLEIQNEVAEGTKGCSLSSGEIHTTLQYSGIQVTGSSNSYVDVVIGDSNQFINDYSFTIFASAKNVLGGNIFHYKQDDSAVDSNVEKIKDVILWYNQTHLVAETHGPNDESYGSVVTTINSASFVNNWTGFGVRYEQNKPRIWLLTDKGVTTKHTTLNDASIGQPGMIRIGGSFDTSRSHFYGDLICVNMFDYKISDDLLQYINECDLENWNQNALGTGGGSGEICEDYYVIKQRDAGLESITPLNTMTTSSRVRCADFCMSKELCWSFTINKAVGKCKLFDADYSSNTVSSIETDYYIRR